MKSETQIVNGCLAAERWAQEALYKQFAPFLFGVAKRYTPDSDLAADILQESFIKIFKSLSSFNGGSLQAWLKRILVNTALDHIKKHNTLSMAIEISDANAHEFESLVTFDDTHFDAKHLLMLMDALPTGYRTILNMYAIDGFSHAEIANQLGISEGTSKSQLARARFALLRLLNKSEKSYSYAK